MEWKALRMYACLISIKWLFCILCVRKCLKVQDGTPKRNNRHHKEAWLVELRDSSGEEGVWSPRFSRSFNDWEVEEVESLLLTIRVRRLNPLLEDKMLWKETKDGIFLVNLFVILFPLCMHLRLTKRLG